MDICLLILASVMAVSGNSTSTNTTSNNLTTTTVDATNLTTTLPTTTNTTTTVDATNLTTTLPTTTNTTTVVSATNLTTTLPTTTNTTTAVSATNLTTTLPTTTNTTTVVSATNLTTTLTTTLPTTTNTTTVVSATNLTTTLPTTTTVDATNLPTTTTTTTVVSATNLTTTNSSTVTNSTSSLSCQNGGKQTNGFCICPDDFTGQLCEKPNFCPETSVNDFTFPKTLIGQAGYSKDQCPSGSVNAGFPQATAWCLNETRSFSTPQKLNCHLTLNTIDTNLLNASPDTTQILASSTQILTSNRMKLTPQNISTAAKIVNNLLADRSGAQDIYLASITTVIQLLNANREQFYNVTTESISRYWINAFFTEQNIFIGKPLLSLTKTLQTFSLTQNDSGLLLVQPNIAIHSVKVSQSSEVQMTVFSALNNENPTLSSGDPLDSLSANRIKINNTFALQDDKVPIDVQMNVKLPQDNKDTKIGFVLYNNDQFFKSRVFNPSLDVKRRVISGHVEEDKVLEFVQFMMKTQEVSSSIRLHDFVCVTWEYAVQDWTTNGCKKIRNAENQSCKCEGATKFANFAMLMSFRSDPEISLALGTISIIGCALSVMGLIITVIFQILTRKSRRSSPTILLVSICVCMVIVYLLFIFGIRNTTLDSSSNLSGENVIPASDFYRAPDYGPCTAFTALLHYFLLAAFSWSMLYSAHIFLLIKNTISGPPRHFMVLSAVVGWGLPAVVVGISIGITYRVEDPLNYRQEAVCWLAAVDQQNIFDVTKPMLWGFLLPVALMLLFNITVLLYFAYTTCRTNPDLNSSQVPPLRKKVLGCVSMAVVLGISWIIGYFLLLETKPIMHTILSFAFCICNTTQGIQIFVLFTLRTTVFKKKALTVLKTIPAPVLARHSKTFDLWVMKEADREESYRSKTCEV